MIPIYRPGRSPLHRMPTGQKLLTAMALALAIALAPTNPWLLAAVVALVAGCYLFGGLGLPEVGRQLYNLRWIILVMLVPQAMVLTPLTVAANVTRVVAVILLGNLVTLTTRTADLIDAIEHAFSPLRHLGINPSRIAFMLSMTITTIPVIAGFAAQIREAQRARGVPVYPLAFVVPLLVMALKHSDDLADALAARGID